MGHRHADRETANTQSTASTRITAAMPLVRAIASRMRAQYPNHVDFDDLVGDGMVGLVQAAASFDPNAGTAFPSYAAPRIRGAILDGLRGEDLLSRRAREQVNRLAAAENAFVARHHRYPTVSELQEHEELSGYDIYALQVWRRRGVAYGLDGSRDDHLTAQMSQHCNPEKVSLDNETSRELSAVLGQLSGQEYLVVTALYFDGESQGGIGERLGVTASRVSRIHRQALAHMRTLLKTPESGV